MSEDAIGLLVVSGFIMGPAILMGSLILLVELCDLVWDQLYGDCDS